MSTPDQIGGDGRRDSGWSALPLIFALYGYEIAAPFLEFASAGRGVSSTLRFDILAMTLCLLPRLGFRLSRASFLLLPFLCFALLYALRLIENHYLRGLVWADDPARGLFLLVGAGIIPGVILATYSLRISENRLFRAVLTCAAIYCVGLMLNLDALAAQVEFGQAALGKLNPISLGALSVSFALCLLLLPAQGQASAIAKWLVIGVLLAATAYSQARGPLVSFGVTLALMAILMRTKDRRAILGATVLLFGLVAILSAVSGQDMIGRAIGRFLLSSHDFISADHDTASLRLVSWHVAWAQFLDHPFAGDIVYSRFLNQYPHNYLLESLISVGVLGTAILVLHLGLCGRAVLRVIRSPQVSRVDLVLIALLIKEFTALQLSGAVWSGTAFIVLSFAVLVRSAYYRVPTTECAARNVRYA